MKKYSTLLIISAILNGLLAFTAQAQCTYIANNGGLFSSASTWQVSSTTCSDTPTSGTDAIIIINGFTVTLDVDYALAKGGSISIRNSGSLIGGANLILGDGSGNQSATQLTIEPGGTLQVAQLTVNKATIMIADRLSATEPTSLTTNCNLVLISSLITNNSQAFINGSIDLSKGAPTTRSAVRAASALSGAYLAAMGPLESWPPTVRRPLLPRCALSSSNPKGAQDRFPVTMSLFRVSVGRG